MNNFAILTIFLLFDIASFIFITVTKIYK